METGNIQISFVEKIKEMIPQGLSLVSELSDLLGVSNDSAYRRIRGETSFTIEEVVKLCERYKISFDSFSNSTSGTVTFYYDLVTENEESFLKYLNNIHQGMQRIKGIPNAEIIYAAEDIPIFQLFNRPELAAFKMFYWMKSVVNIPAFEKKKVDLSLVSDEIMNAGLEILKIYKKIPSVEIWSDKTLSSILKQIDYYHESGTFQSKADALHICEELQSLLDDIQKQAEQSTKADIAGFENNYLLYNCDIEMGNNCIHVKANNSSVVYLRHHTFNQLTTTNNVFCLESENWLKGLIKKSTLISGVSEKQRYQFFQKSSEAIEKLKERIR
jgi:hypothetical protein